MGARIRELRERSPWKQQHMANKLNVGLRMYQRIEQRGTTDWERAEAIAEIHDVDPMWIWSGEERKPAPDLIGQFDGSVTERLARIEDLLERMEARQVEALAAVASIQHDLQVQQSPRKRTADGQEATGE
jgi:transcriptional regulator with XRE-family HTH domain